MMTAFMPTMALVTDMSTMNNRAMADMAVATYDQIKSRHAMQRAIILDVATILENQPAKIAA
jgi:hypothetical protein